MTKILQTKQDLEKQLDEQLDLLKVLADAYDAGNVIVAKSIATTIRLLLHHNSRSGSYSLIDQLGLKETKFFDTSSPKAKISTNTIRVGSFSGLINIPMGVSKQDFIPHLDDTLPEIFGYVKFDEYWNRIIFIDQQNNSFTRRDIIRAVANQDGGAHVDPKIEEKYKKLARENSLGWVTVTNEKTWNNLKGSELAAIRQIGHEILRTFLPDYPFKKMVTSGDGIVIGGEGILITTKEAENKTIVPKVGRNDKCPCGSGLKYKKCHGK